MLKKIAVLMGLDDNVGKYAEFFPPRHLYSIALVILQKLRKCLNSFIKNCK